MTERSSFEELMKRLEAGDHQAAAEVFQRFGNRLIGLARSKLDEKFRQKVDPEDILQSVWKSFFRRHADGQYELDDWDSLWSLLVVITLRKCGHKVEHFTAARRDINREQTTKTEEARSTWRVVAREPTPSHATMLTETVEQVICELDDEHKRQIFELSLQGHSAEEISQETQFSIRTVHRVRQRVHKILEKLQQAGN